jgi:antitoxin HicB
MFKYSVSLAWSDEDNGYIALIPELPGLSAFGETPEEAAQEAKIAAEGFLEVYEEDGKPVPEPMALSPYSGQFRLRLPKSLHAALAQLAKQEGVSLNTLAVTLLSERHTAQSIDKKLGTIENALFNYVLKSGTPQPQSSGARGKVINIGDHQINEKECQ